MTLKCSCGTTNRLPMLGATTARTRCGKCKHVFTPRELSKAVNEAPPARVPSISEFPFELERELDTPWDQDLESEAGSCEFLPDPQDSSFCLSCGLHKLDHGRSKRGDNE